MQRTFYDVLGVGSDATAEELAAAWERRARVLADGAPLRPAPEHEAVAAALLRQLDQAFSVLDDAASRQAYDTALETGIPLDPSVLEEVDARFQEEYRTTVRRIGDRMSRYVQRLLPGVRWSTREACAPWDLVLEGKDGGVMRTVSLKVLADLHPGDLVATIESAEAELAASPAGHPQTLTFLLVAGLLLETGRLFTLAEEFNRAAWVDRDASGPRALLAYADLDGNLPVIPAVETPIPDLAQVCAAIDPEGLPPGRVRPASSPGTLFSILVVDDERLPYQVVRKALAEEPFQLHHAQNWLESREFLNEDECAVLVLDLNMPSISGDKLAMYVHSHPEIAPKPRIVIHSGLPADELRRVAARVGAHACLQKGCGPEAIREAVRSGVRAYTRDRLLMGPW